jgi:tetratricopeptide (TPR) repeat protein
VQPLTPPDSHHLLAAQGWLELGNHHEANEELEKISPAMRGHPDVLELRWQVYAHEQKWEACVDIARAIMSLDPDRDTGWIHHSYALHLLKRTEEAYTHLVTVADDFPGNWHVPYNLACYCAQLGRCDEAQEWFKKAVAINDKEVPLAGIDDPDLKPLWDSMSTTFWKKAD